MSLLMNGYNFGGVLHQMPEEGEFDFNSHTASFYGVAGEVEIVDAEHGRDIMIACTFTGFANVLLLQTAMQLVDARKTTLIDKTLAVTTLTFAQSYFHCSFRGLSRIGGAVLDGSGVNGWRQDGILRFRQLKRTT
jgi:hypothetical protein